MLRVVVFSIVTSLLCYAVIANSKKSDDVEVAEEKWILINFNHPRIRKECGGFLLTDYLFEIY